LNNIENAKNITKALKKIEANSYLGLTQNQLRIIAAFERLIARFETDPLLSRHLIFKGGFALLKLIENPRFTHDLDASFFNINGEKIEPLIIAAAYKDLGDGIFYFNVKTEEIKITDKYPGIRFNMSFQIAESADKIKNIHKLSCISFDIALAEHAYKSIQQEVMPSILSHTNPITWQIYSLEQIFSEKLQTAVIRGATNSRAKDIYDLIKLSDVIEDNQKLVYSIKQIFLLRKTDLPPDFYDFFSSLNLLVLQNAWRSVSVINKMPFANLWDDLLKVARRIDYLFKTH
jgi:predicted nucleotidyltransferase component of viral defense system